MIHDADFTDEQLLLTTVQAARVLGVGRTTIYELMKTGQLHAVHISRSCRISWAELERFVSKLDTGSAPVPPGQPTSERRWRRVTGSAGQRSLVAVGTTAPHGPVA